MTVFVPIEILAVIVTALLSGWTGALVWTVRTLWRLDHRLTTVETVLKLGPLED